MIEAEEWLLESVRAKLDAAFADGQVDVELDQDAPAMSSDLYIAVIPGSISPGLRNQPSVGDSNLGVEVCVMLRSTIARDRRRQLLYENLRNVNSVLTKVHEAIHGKYDVMNAANQGLVQAGVDNGHPTQGAFHHPLIWSSYTKPLPFFADTHAGKRMQQGDPKTGLKRSALFGQARYMKIIN